MSDTETTPRGRGVVKGGSILSWNEHELLVYLLSTIEYSGVTLDYTNAPLPFGRTVRGCVQKINKLKIALRAEIDAIKNGEPISDAAATPLKKGGRKRKAEDDESTPKKRGGGRKKKVASEEPEEHEDIEEFNIKNEIKDENGYDSEA